MDLENQEVTKSNEVSMHVEPTAADIARQQGWRPQEEWEGSPEDWVDAKTFNQRGEFMDRIKSQSSLIKKLEKRLSQQEGTLKDLADHHKRVSEIEYEKALKELKTLKKEALGLGEYDTVVDIDDKISDLKDSKPVSKPNEQPVHPEVEDWLEENTWYTDDKMLQGAANAYMADEVARDPSVNKDVKGFLSRVTQKLKEEFPNKFGVKQRKINPVAEPGDGDSSSTSSKPKYNSRHLNDLQKQTAKKFIAAGAMKSMDDYAKQLGEMGFLDSQIGV